MQFTSEDEIVRVESQWVQTSLVCIPEDSEDIPEQAKTYHQVLNQHKLGCPKSNEPPEATVNSVTRSSVGGNQPSTKPFGFER